MFLRRATKSLSPLIFKRTITQISEFLPVAPDLTSSQATVRSAISSLCKPFDDDYYLNLDKTKRFPHELYEALAKNGWLGICLPEKYGGSELGLPEAMVMMQTLSESGGGMTAASAIHINIFGLEPVVKFGTEDQKERHLPPLIHGEEKACFAVTEPNVGLDTLKMQTKAVRNGDHYVLSGQKIWISTAQHAHKVLLLARTAPYNKDKPSEGLSLFYTPLDRKAVQVSEIDKMGRNGVDSNTLMFEEWKVPVDDRLGPEGNGFKQIMHGMNAERILIGAEALGLGYAALRRATAYAKERVVFDRPIGQNQSIAHPLADSWIKLEAARMLLQNAAKMYSEGYKDGEYANAGKYLAAEAAWEACERAVMVHGGMGYAKEYHVERYLREVLVPRIVPVSREMILNYVSQRVLGLPKSY